MIRKSACLPLMALCCLTLVACSSGCRRRHALDLRDGAAVRVINAVSSWDDITLDVNNHEAWRGSHYRSTSGYKAAEPGNYSISMAPNAAQTSMTPAAPMTLVKGSVYTVVAIDPRHDGDPLRTLIWKEDRETPIPSDRARVLFVHAGPDLGPLEFLVNNIVAGDSTRFAHHGEPMLLNPGTYALKVINAGADDIRPVIGPVNIRFEDGQSYTVIAMGRKSTGTLALEAYSDRL